MADDYSRRLLDAVFRARPEIKELRDLKEEIRIKLIQTLYGGTEVPEFIKWLKGRLQIK